MINIALIRDYMQKKKLTQTELAECLDVSRVTISNLMTNRSCSLDTLVAVADLINISLDALLERSAKDSLHVVNEDRSVYTNNKSTTDTKIDDAKKPLLSKYVVEKSDVKSLIDTIYSQQRTIEYLVKK